MIHTIELWEQVVEWLLCQEDCLHEFDDSLFFFFQFEKWISSKSLLEPPILGVHNSLVSRRHFLRGKSMRDVHGQV